MKVNTQGPIRIIGPGSLVSVKRSFDSLQDTVLHRFDRVRIKDVDFNNDTEDLQPTAIHLERPGRAKIENVNIFGDYDVGILTAFGLYGNYDSIAVFECNYGFVIGSGNMPVPGDDKPIIPGGTFSNSASNLTKFSQCKYAGYTDQDIGYTVEGAGGVIFEQSVVEGGACHTAWNLNPRSANDVMRLTSCHLEVESELAIGYDGYQGILIIDGLLLRKQPKMLIDAAGDQNSTIIIRNNTWKDIPPIKVPWTTKIKVEENNNFLAEDLHKMVTRVGNRPDWI